MNYVVYLRVNLSFRAQSEFRCVEIMQFMLLGILCYKHLNDAISG